MVLLTAENFLHWLQYYVMTNDIKMKIVNNEAIYYTQTQANAFSFLPFTFLGKGNEKRYLLNKVLVPLNGNKMTIILWGGNPNRYNFAMNEVIDIEKTKEIMILRETQPNYQISPKSGFKCRNNVPPISSTMDKLWNMLNWPKETELNHGITIEIKTRPLQSLPLYITDFAAISLD